MTILCMVPLSIVGGGVNLYRFHMNVTNYTDKDALMLSIHFVIAYLTFCFGDNYSGQVMLNASADYYDATYDTLWYLLPPKMQKMVLFTIMKCQLFLELNCGGLYLVSNEGSARVTDTICIITYTLFKMIVLSWI
ncbi:uncharacterized protein LOC143361071 [Halictus rubicundus]|uniref:uncharacterized protein LOC143361071 n=1 Tax=Halictus rubicundus TaxID=77578 RepID=UPI004035FB62